MRFIYLYLKWISKSTDFNINNLNPCHKFESLYPDGYQLFEECVNMKIKIKIGMNSKNNSK